MSIVTSLGIAMVVLTFVGMIRGEMNSVTFAFDLRVCSYKRWRNIQARGLLKLSLQESYYSRLGQLIRSTHT